MDEVKYGFFIHVGQKEHMIETDGRLIEHDFDVLKILRKVREKSEKSQRKYGFPLTIE